MGSDGGNYEIHNSQTLAPILEVWPRGHAMQSPAPLVSLYIPSGHNSHDTPPNTMEYVPGLHGIASIPEFGQKWPTGQIVHEPPSSVLYVPSAHGSHLPPLSDENPAGHGMHTAAFF